MKKKIRISSLFLFEFNNVDIKIIVTSDERLFSPQSYRGVF